MSDDALDAWMLRVADASIMRDLVSAPINPAVLMGGERVADLVRQGF